MPPAAPQGQQNPEANMGFLWMIVAVFVFAFLIWFFGHTYLVMAFLAMKRFEIAVIHFFTIGIDSVKDLILNKDPEEVTFQQVVIISKAAGYYLKFPCTLFLLLASVLLFSKNSAVKFCQVYDMKALLEEGTADFPHEIPVLESKIDLVTEDIEKGAWAMAMTPLEFAKKYDLIDVEKPQGMLQLSISTKYKITLRREKTLTLFANQLGAPWQDIHQLPPYMKALFAAFSAKAARQSDECRNFLYAIARSSGHKLDFSGTDELLKKYADTPQVKMVTEKHAYVLTVFASLLKSARLDGVLPSAEFMWLKPLDRRLWFMLNAVGRQTATVEVAGPFSHWKSELAMGEKIKSPMVEKAVDALDIALQDILYKPDDEEKMDKV